MIVEWVRDDQELFLMAPQTLPPLTIEKVTDWCTTANGRQPWLLWNYEADEPLGYGELNPLQYCPGHWWIGHFLIAPAARGRGLGRRFVRLLLAHAFLRHAAQRVGLVVFPENLAAIYCYERAGFCHDGQEQRPFEASGTVHTLLRMTIRQSGFLAGE
jgi:RimJ/RimL family protein N-acetyltransferase